MPRIVTSFVYPPIPVRSFDWVAHYDDPEGATASGETEAEAVNDLLNNHPPSCVDCGGSGSMGIGECANCDGSGERPPCDPLDPITGGAAHGDQWKFGQSREAVLSRIMSESI